MAKTCILCASDRITLHPNRDEYTCHGCESVVTGIGAHALKVRLLGFPPMTQFAEAHTQSHEYGEYAIGALVCDIIDEHDGRPPKDTSRLRHVFPVFSKRSHYWQVTVQRQSCLGVNGCDGEL